MNAPYLPPSIPFRNAFLDAIDPASKAYDEMVACATKFDGSYEIARDKVHALIAEFAAEDERQGRVS